MDVDPPFRISEEIIAIVNDIADEDLESFVEVNDNHTSDDEIELCIYACYTAFRRLDSAKHLKQAVNKVDTWDTITSEDHPDKRRRGELFAALSFIQWNNSQQQNKLIERTQRLDKGIEEDGVSDADRTKGDWEDRFVGGEGRFFRKNDRLEESLGPFKNELDPDALSAPLAMALLWFSSGCAGAMASLIGADRWHKFDVDFSWDENSLGTVLTLDQIDSKISKLDTKENLSGGDQNQQGQLDRLKELSDLHHKRFYKTKEFRDLKKAINYARECVDQPEVISSVNLKERYLENLRKLVDGRHFFRYLLSDIELDPMRCEESIPKSEFDARIDALEAAINACPSEDDKQPLIATLFPLLVKHFRDDETVARITYIDRMVQIAEDYSALISADAGATLTSIIADGWFRRFGLTEDITDLCKSIDATTAAIFIKNENHDDWVLRLNQLIQRFRLRYQVAGSIYCLDDEYATALSSLNLDILRFPSLQEARNVNTFVFELYNHCGHDSPPRAGADGIQTQAEIQHVIHIGEILLALAPPGQSDFLLLLCSFMSYQIFKLYTSSKHDLDKAINLLIRKANTANGNRDGSSSNNDRQYFSIIGRLLSHRYSEYNALDDLRGALELMEIGCTSKTDCEDNKDLDNLDRAIMLLKNAQEGRNKTNRKSNLEASLSLMGKLAGSKFSKELRYLFNFAEGHDLMFQYTGHIDSLDESIRLTRMALEFGRGSGHEHGYSLFKLGVALNRRFQASENAKDLEEAIYLTNKALDHFGPDISYRGLVLFGLGCYYLDHYSVTEDDESYILSFQHFKESWQCQLEGPGQRLRITTSRFLSSMLVGCLSGSGCSWEPMSRALKERMQDLAKLLPRPGWEFASEALKEAMQDLTKLSPRFLRNSERHSSLQFLRRVGPDTAATILSAESNPIEALRYLEMGRGIAASIMMDLRSNISDLQKLHPELAARFVAIRDRLDISEEHSMSRVLDAGFIVNKDQDRQDAEVDFNHLLEQIRKKPSFEHFLQPPTAAEMMHAAGSDYIVIINMGMYRCDAFLITKDAIDVVPLPQLNDIDLEEKANQFGDGDGMEAWEALEWLWDVAACPILEALGITAAPENDAWPHIIWIPTGMLSRLPIHAAGSHFEGSGNSVLDRAISSYSLSIKSYAQKRHDASFDMGKANAIFVSMSETPGQGSLPFVEEEWKVIESICPSLGLNVVKKSSPVVKEDVLGSLKNCKIFHFAGHGVSDPSEPSLSRLLLDDWQSNPLTVEDLWEQRFLDNPPFLAYLSACSTGATEADDFSNEGIHLISACQLAGFRHAIGTLWEVSDRYCAEVTKTLYETLRDEGMTDRSVALGLHKALRTLRQRSVEDCRIKGYVPRTGSTRRKALDIKGKGRAQENPVPQAQQDGENWDINDRGFFNSFQPLEDIITRSHRQLSRRFESGESCAEDALDDERAAEDVRKLTTFKLDMPDLYWVPYVHFGA
ncbi:hypothetical protein TWF481_011984 [Arthrobotrys musiformis]|uniref:CHAT domain-containing protein n=1 Tax=Arthrobotrys musiformis TaxID=47236 RepID=A0AAV9VVV4_9PEZI